MRSPWLAVALATWGLAAQAQGTAPQKTALCTACHGQLGMGLLPDTPHLAGQPAIYLVAQLKAFRAGTRRHEVMQVVAKGLADADIEELANWYAAQAIELKKP